VDDETPMEDDAPMGVNSYPDDEDRTPAEHSASECPQDTDGETEGETEDETEGEVEDDDEAENDEHGHDVEASADTYQQGTTDPVDDIVRTDGREDVCEEADVSRMEGMVVQPMTWCVSGVSTSDDRVPSSVPMPDSPVPPVPSNAVPAPPKPVPAPPSPVPVPHHSIPAAMSPTSEDGLDDDSLVRPPTDPCTTRSPASFMNFASDHQIPRYCIGQTDGSEATHVLGQMELQVPIPMHIMVDELVQREMNLLLKTPEEDGISSFSTGHDDCLRDIHIMHIGPLHVRLSVHGKSLDLGVTSQGRVWTFLLWQRQFKSMAYRLLHGGHDNGFMARVLSTGATYTESGGVLGDKARWITCVASTDDGNIILRGRAVPVTDTHVDLCPDGIAKTLSVEAQDELCSNPKRARGTRFHAISSPRDSRSNELPVPSPTQLFTWVLNAHILLLKGNSPVLMAQAGTSTDVVSLVMIADGQENTSLLDESVTTTGDEMKAQHPSQSALYQPLSVSTDGRRHAIPLTFLNGGAFSIPAAIHPEVAFTTTTGHLALVFTTTDLDTHRRSPHLRALSWDMLLGLRPDSITRPPGVPTFSEALDQLMTFQSVDDMPPCTYGFMQALLSSGRRDVARRIMAHPRLKVFAGTTSMDAVAPYADDLRKIVTVEGLSTSLCMAPGPLPVVARCLATMCQRPTDPCNTSWYDNVVVPWEHLLSSDRLLKIMNQHPILDPVQEYIDRIVESSNHPPVLMDFERILEAFNTAGACLLQTTLSGDLLPLYGDIDVFVKRTLLGATLPDEEGADDLVSWACFPVRENDRGPPREQALSTVSISHHIKDKLPIILRSASLEKAMHDNSQKVVEDFIDLCHHRCGVPVAVRRILTELFIQPVLQGIPLLRSNAEIAAFAARVIEFSSG
jgi:hypothetical protein